MIVSLILGILIGAVLGLTGAGGGILAVPALVFGMGWSMQQAAPVALIAVVAGAAIGAFEGLQRKLVRYRAALLMAAVGALFTPFGYSLAQVLPQRWLTALFALVMLVVALRLIRKGHETMSAHAHKLGSINPETGRFDWNLPTALLLGAIGAFTGFMTGLLGVGGGFVMVPMLRRFTNVSMHGIVATSLLVIALVGSAGVLTALRHGGLASTQVTLLFAAATALGMLLGRFLARHLAERYVQYGFATILVLVAGGLLLKSLV
jgi:uncharacterized protein